MLPTPQARDYKDQLLGDPHGRGQINLPQAVHLLPTPLTTDYNTPASEWEPNRDRLQLRDINALLPTPTAQAAKHGSTPDITAHGYGSNLWDLPHLLPTPRAGLEKAQVIKDRQDRPGDVSNLENALTQVVLLGTPTARMTERSQRFQSRGKSPAELARSLGDSSVPPLSGGSSFSDDEPQAHLF
jgi:hypothetical protein